MYISSGKKFAILSLVAISLGSAMVFAKRPAVPTEVAPSRGLRDSVTRRIAPAAPAATVVPQALKPKDDSAFELPIVSARAPSESPRVDFAPNYQHSFNPAGALLEPLADDLAPSGHAMVEGDAASTGAPASAASQGTVGPLLSQADAADDLPTQHKVVDGDTLSRLAARYLGSSDRYLEIFNANRGRLNNPDLLPIGSVLEIPPRNKRRADAGLNAAMLNGAASSNAASNGGGPIPVVHVPALVPVRKAAAAR